MLWFWDWLVAEWIRFLFFSFSIFFNKCFSSSLEAAVHTTEEIDDSVLSHLGERFTLVLNWRLVLREVWHPRVAGSRASQVHYNKKKMWEMLALVACSSYKQINNAWKKGCIALVNRLFPLLLWKVFMTYWEGVLSWSSLSLYIYIFFGTECRIMTLQWIE